MSRLFWPYLIFYTVSGIYGVWREILEPQRLVLLAFDVLANGLAVMGMLIYRLSRDWSRIRALWQVVFFLVLLENVVSYGFYLYDLSRDKEKSFVGIVMTMVLVILVELPVFVMNGRVAFSEDDHR